MIKKLFIFLLQFAVLHAMAQDAHVAYKTENFSYANIQNLKLKMNCEMADIIITKIEGDKINIKCTYSAKHLDKNIATKELSRHNVSAKKTLNEIFISNYFTLIAGEEEPKAKLNIKFEIGLPVNVTVDISNHFGSIKLENIKARGTITQDFGKIDFRSCFFDLVLKSKLSEISALLCNGSLHIQNKSGNILVDQFNGSLLHIKNSNAQVTINNLGTATNLYCALSNCTLLCKKINYMQRSLNISSYKEPIKTDFKLPIQSKNNYFLIQQNKSNATFIIESDYSKINLL